VTETNFVGGRLSKLSWKLHRHVLNQPSSAFLRRLFGSDQAGNIDFRQYSREFESFKSEMTVYAANEIAENLRPDYEHVLSPNNSWLELFYMIIRIQKPDTIVETGCASGLTSAVLLFALKQNRKGRLTSIDIPAKKGQFEMNWSIPDGLEPGFLIPPSLRENGKWSLILENARDALPRLLGSEGFRQIDVFYHDSDHSFGHQMWEYLTVWPHLSRGGLLLSDDIGWSCAFRDFSRHVGRAMAIHKGSANFGAIRKSE
jgi:predicted O-methyltransferase YrrM